MVVENSDLPLDIIFNAILPRLPAESLLRFRCVCKSWRSCIDDQHFTHAHVQQSKANPKFLCDCEYHSFILQEENRHPLANLEPDRLPQRKFSIRACCDGLLCLQGDSPPHSLSILNIMTRRSLPLPSPPQHPVQTHVYEIIRDPSSGAYKLLLVYSTPSRELQGAILTLGIDISWRTFDVPASGTSARPTRTVVDGTCYWVNVVEQDNPARLVQQIIAFKISDENVSSSIAYPRFCQYDDGSCSVYHSKCLAEIAGCLHLLHFDASATNMDMWVFKDHTSSHEWTKLITLRFGYGAIDGFGAEFVNVIGKGAFGGNVLLKICTSEGLVLFLSYDPQANQVEILKRVRESEVINDVFVYVDSVVSVGSSNKN